MSIEHESGAHVHAPPCQACDRRKELMEPAMFRGKPQKPTENGQDA